MGVRIGCHTMESGILPSLNRHLIDKDLSDKQARVQKQQTNPIQTRGGRFYGEIHATDCLKDWFIYENSSHESNTCWGKLTRKWQWRVSFTFPHQLNILGLRHQSTYLSACLDILGSPHVLMNFRKNINSPALFWMNVEHAELDSTCLANVYMWYELLLWSLL